MRKRKSKSVALLIMATSLFAHPGMADTWGAVDCQIIVDFIERHKVTETEIHTDRMTLERSLRGTDHEAFRRIEDALSERCNWP